MEVKCGKCNDTVNISGERLKVLYEWAHGELTQVELMASINGLYKRTCKDGKFHSFNLTDNSNSQIVEIVNKYKGIAEKLKLEIEPGIKKEEERIARAEQQLEEARNKKLELEGQIKESVTRVEQLENNFEQIAGTRNVLLWS